MIAFLDTNVLIYAQSTGAKSEVARQAILAGGVISVQVLSEFASVLRRKFGPLLFAIQDGTAKVPNSSSRNLSQQKRRFFKPPPVKRDIVGRLYRRIEGANNMVF